MVQISGAQRNLGCAKGERMSKLASAWVVIGMLWVSHAEAQVTIDVSKITCGQFLQNKVVSNRTIAIWLSGFYAGKRNDFLIDTQAVERNVGRVTRYCESNRNVSLTQAVETTLGAAK